MTDKQQRGGGVKMPTATLCKMAKPWKPHYTADQIVTQPTSFTENHGESHDLITLLSSCFQRELEACIREKREKWRCDYNTKLQKKPQADHKSTRHNVQYLVNNKLRRDSREMNHYKVNESVAPTFTMLCSPTSLSFQNTPSPQSKAPSWLSVFTSNFNSGKMCTGSQSLQGNM